jgi:hypothetical protein
VPGQNYVNIALESTYGTPPGSGWRGVPVESDDHKPNVLVLQPNAVIYGQQGPSTTGRRAVERDAAGVIKTYLASSGIGKLLKASFGSAAITTPSGATNARQMVFETTSAASTDSLAVQVQREAKGGGPFRDTYGGGKVTELRLSQAVAPENGGTTDTGLARLEVDVDYQGRVAGFAQQVPTYPNPDLYFSVGECVLSIGEDLDNLVEKCLNKFDFKMPIGLDTNDPCIQGTFTKEEPVRGSLPDPTMDLGWTYKTNEFYDAWVNGDILAFRSLWTAPDEFEIESGFVPSVQVDVAAFALNGEAPQFDRDGRSTQDLPCSILHDGTNPMVRITIITSDTTY